MNTISRSVTICLTAAAMVLSVVSCSMSNDVDELIKQDQEYSTDAPMVAYGVLERGSAGEYDKILTDNKTVLVITRNDADRTLYSAATERIYFNFSITSQLTPPQQSTDRWYGVTLNAIYPLVSRPVVIRSSITDEQYASLGRDGVDVVSAWFGGGYLNIEFRYLCNSNPDHRFELLFDDTDTKDGIARFVLTHDAAGDVGRDTVSMASSFKMTDLIARYAQSDSSSGILVNDDGKCTVSLAWYDLKGNYKQQGGQYYPLRTAAYSAQESQKIVGNR